MLEKIYMYGFYALIIVVSVFYWSNSRINPIKITGASSWIDIYTDNSKVATSFLSKTLGLVVVGGGDDADYSTLRAQNGILPFANVKQLDGILKEKNIPSGTVAYFTTTSYEYTHKRFIQEGAKELLSYQNANGMIYGIYSIPGDIIVGIVQYY